MYGAAYSLFVSVDLRAYSLFGSVNLLSLHCMDSWRPNILSHCMDSWRPNILSHCMDSWRPNNNNEVLCNIPYLLNTSTDKYAYDDGCSETLAKHYFFIFLANTSKEHSNRRITNRGKSFNCPIEQWQNACVRCHLP